MLPRTQRRMKKLSVARRRSQVARLKLQISGFMTFDVGRETCDRIFGTVLHAPYGAP
jgi:hypothetical protein